MDNKEIQKFVRKGATFVFRTQVLVLERVLVTFSRLVSKPLEA